MPPKRGSETALINEKSKKLIFSPSQYAKLSEVQYFFRDPPNADSLSNQVLPLESSCKLCSHSHGVSSVIFVSLLVSVDQAPSPGATTEADGGNSNGETESNSTKFHRLQFTFSPNQCNNERNRPRGFLAMYRISYRIGGSDLAYIRI